MVQGNIFALDIGASIFLQTLCPATEFRSEPRHGRFSFLPASQDCLRQVAICSLAVIGVCSRGRVRGIRRVSQHLFNVLYSRSSIHCSCSLPMRVVNSNSMRKVSSASIEKVWRRSKKQMLGLVNQFDITLLHFCFFHSVQGDYPVLAGSSTFRSQIVGTS